MQPQTNTAVQTRTVSGTSLAVATAVALAAAGLAFLMSPPGATSPTVITPADGTVVTGPTNAAVFYEWTSMPNAVNYQFQLDYWATSSQSWVKVFDYKRGKFTTNYTLMRKGYGSYRVRVQAHFNDGTTSEFSPYSRFEFRAAPATARYTCVDSDGINLSTGGTVTITETTSGQMNKLGDFCLGDGRIVEARCNAPSGGWGLIGQVTTSCQIGETCQGAPGQAKCAPGSNPTPTPLPVVYTCSENDGGQNVSVSSNAVVLKSGSALVLNSLLDQCASSDTVSESFCKAASGLNVDLIGSVQVTCQTGQVCLGGSCVTPTSTP